MGQPGTQESGAGHLLDEPDIGSGEKSPGQRETEEQIKQVPKQDGRPDAAKSQPGAPGHGARSGS